jgi:tRNA(Phe) wybutosine-synthesizing methylase Tyw3
LVDVYFPAEASQRKDGRDHWEQIRVDRCIAPLVKAINAAGISTVASCCGHGRRPGRISLRDGRDLFIASDYETGQAVSAAFPPLNEEGA